MAQLETVDLKTLTPLVVVSLLGETTGRVARETRRRNHRGPRAQEHQSRFVADLDACARDHGNAARQIGSGRPLAPIQRRAARAQRVVVVVQLAVVFLADVAVLRLLQSPLRCFGSDVDGSCLAFEQGTRLGRDRERGRSHGKAQGALQGPVARGLQRRIIGLAQGLPGDAPPFASQRAPLGPLRKRDPTGRLSQPVQTTLVQLRQERWIRTHALEPGESRIGRTGIVPGATGATRGLDC